ncbi:histidine phosphatase family protein [Bacillus sp. NEB1478]|uniref:histidine phosphatase family protein n=1 Tax=Bacillus sp. NEB1478 TaxID=3073816 RepID=UPI002873103C|nr:histidine phosphatase family protein [Bacillus sp. NEB1478]WNB93216.1 histidine phosphatase family protein [Bacillus sp. NEB1478]
MTTIGFIRHGETDWNIEKRAQGCIDIPLNDQGKQQAFAVAERCKNENWDIIYTSPLSRAFHTANAIAEQTGLSLIIDERLREISFGDTEGTTEAERVEKWGEEWKTLELGREKNEEADTRWKAALKEIVQNHPDQKVLIVSHGALLVRIFKHLLQDQTDKWYGLNNTSFSKFRVQNEDWFCELFNCNKHLNERLTT